MNLPTAHAPWCTRTTQEHALCQQQVAAIEIVDVQTVTVTVSKARCVPAIITVIHRVGGRERLIPLTRVTARELAAALTVAVDLLSRTAT